MDRKALGKKIRTERQQMNLTQEQLAEAAGVSTAYIGLVEHGQRSVTLEKLIDLANIFHVSIDYLLMDSVNSANDADFALLKTLWQQAPDSARMLFWISQNQYCATWIPDLYFIHMIHLCMDTRLSITKFLCSFSKLYTPLHICYHACNR